MFAENIAFLVPSSAVLDAKMYSRGEEIAAGGTSEMAFLFIIKVCTSDSTLVCSVRCGGSFGSLPRCSRSAASDHPGGHTRGKGRFVADTDEAEAEEG